MVQGNLWRYYNRWCNHVRDAENELLKERGALEYYSELIREDGGKESIKELGDYVHYLMDLTLPAEIERMNLYQILSVVQKKSGIDLGVCEYLDVKVREHMRRICLRTQEENLTPQCSLNSGLYVSGLELCIFKERNNCPEIRKVFANKGIVLANRAGVLIE